MDRSHRLICCLPALLIALAACAPNPPRPASPAAPAAAGPAASAPAAPAAVAPPVASNAAHYRCDQGIEFSVRFADDSATVEAGARGTDVLLRDAGGTTPQQTVYSNTRMRAEFGLGAAGNEAMLHYASPALQARCARG
ncbi:hypothetical protein [Caenimonas aquaedulcis]|uniref:C-type lysozyme inhibitor domain-containing protein n=1 Tax=Caenimonas aquaedulcis TaxID=2793270 RepID=A0A931MHK9_9BURK|nr:hypothetical protein [Caenimonas aquaedulcis]MBG9388849.1 hypothetical protein [Caenimonas aquaedulcis]